MKTQIDTSFQTLQNDLFGSGIVAKIGPRAFTVWTAIKHHADYNTGECWPGMRRIADMTGISLGRVKECIDALRLHKLLRVVEASAGTRSTRYVARERLDVRIGQRIICTVVLDYVPAQMRDRVAQIKGEVESGKLEGPAFAECEIIPGPGFVWDAAAGSLKAHIPHSEIPDQPVEKPVENQLKSC